MSDTIVALATPLIKSALGIIRVSGDDAVRYTEILMNKSFKNVEKRSIEYGFITFNGEKIDEVIALIYKEPHSYTGENTAEIICHGSPLIINQIISAYLALGARLAERGEYTLRAYLNDKLDLVQAEAVNEVINARTKEGKNLALLSLQGNASKLILPLKTKIADLLSLIEVNIDYPEYVDIEQANKALIITKVNEMLELLNTLISEGEQGKIIKDGLKVAIVGKPNVGKSSLLNALINEDKAIVTSTAGTTRDVVEGEINLNGIPLTLLDTAGIRDASDQIEKIGIDKAKDTLEKADLVLLLLDASNKLDENDEKLIKLTENKKRIILYNKADIAKEKVEGELYISALQKDIEPLKKRIIELFNIEDESFNRPSFASARQLGLLNKARIYLMDVKKDAENDMPVDLISTNLFSAYNAILEILGEQNTTDLTKEIFSRFCVGK